MAVILEPESPLRIVSMACRTLAVVKPLAAPLEAILGSLEMCMLFEIVFDCGGGGKCCDDGVAGWKLSLSCRRKVDGSAPPIRRECYPTCQSSVATRWKLSDKVVAKRAA